MNKYLKINLQVESWGKKCGIAEYTKLLSYYLPNSSINSNSDDNLIYHLQFHSGLYENIEIVKNELIKQRPKKIVITFHNLDKFKELEPYFDIAILHRKSSIQSNKYRILPHGIIKFKQTKGWARYNLNCGRPVILTYGFAMPHKGIKELIMALVSIKQSFPNITLLCLTSIHDQKKQECINYLEECKDLVRRFNIKTYFWTDFYPYSVISAIMQVADLIVLPQQENKEEASGSVRICLGTGVLTLVTDVYQFKDIQDDVCPKTDIKDLSNRCEELLKNKLLQNYYKKNQEKYVNENCWENVALQHYKLYEEILQ